MNNNTGKVKRNGRRMFKTALSTFRGMECFGAVQVDVRSSNMFQVWYLRQEDLELEDEPYTHVVEVSYRDGNVYSRSRDIHDDYTRNPWSPWRRW